MTIGNEKNGPLTTTPAVMLAPMEGVVDYPMRKLLSGFSGPIKQGGYSRSVTEFVRVTDVRLPERVFFRYCPELKHGCHTDSGMPVYIQLLGSDLTAMASNALRAVQLGAPGVDLNFGCPAKTVNRSNGGSVLLREPSRVAAIVKAVRDAVPAEIPVTAKIRLGYESADSVVEIAEKIERAGATELCIHARTKANGYKPPAYWSNVKPVAAALKIPLTINGEIWSVADALKARRQSGCDRIMLGRGALSCPDLAAQIRAHDAGLTIHARPWRSIVEEVLKQFERSDRSIPRYVGNRTKQWLAYLKREYAGASILFNAIKPLHEVDAINRALEQHISQLDRMDLTTDLHDHHLELSSVGRGERLTSTTNG